MAQDKIVNARIQLKHDTEANWSRAANFVPRQGEMIIYDVDNNYSYPRIKIGDGNSTVSALPFVFAAADLTYDQLRVELVDLLNEEGT